MTRVLYHRDSFGRRFNFEIMTDVPTQGNKCYYKFKLWTDSRKIINYLIQNYDAVIIKYNNDNYNGELERFEVNTDEFTYEIYFESYGFEKFIPLDKIRMDVMAELKLLFERKEKNEN